MQIRPELLPRRFASGSPFSLSVDVRRYPVQMSSRPYHQVSSPKSPQAGEDQEEAPPSRHLWVGNVSQEVTESVLLDKFGKFGTIERVTVYSQRNYAFINFRSVDDARDAKNGLQGVNLGGLAMRIEYAKGAKPSRHLWVGGIGKAVTKEQIEGEFKSFGTLEDFKFLRDRNCAFVDYEKIEDAVKAVDSLNRKRVGDEELRVDFGRSQPPKRESSGRPGSTPSHEERGDPGSRHSWDRADQSRFSAELHSNSGDGHKPSERGGSVDGFRGPADGPQSGSGSGPTGTASARGREKEEPSDVLWVGFPLLSKVDEEGLRRAFVPYGEVERVKTFPGRTYAFVQFKNVEEASRAKVALEGKLFNDPRVHIRFSNSEIGPVDNPRSDGGHLSPTRGRDPPGFADKITGRPLVTNRFSSIISPLRPAGLRPEYYPGGLARGAALARAVGAGAAISLGHGTGRVLGSGGADGRMSFDERGGKGLSGPGARLGGGRSAYNEQWDLPDDEMLREPKRPRIVHRGAQDSGYGSSYEGGRPFFEGKGVGSLPEYGRQEHRLRLAGNTSGDEYRGRSGSAQVDGPGHLAAGQGHAHSGPLAGSGKREGFVSDIGVTGVNEGWRWHGTIAKGGTPVCRAQCLPVGKGIDVAFPDVVNCTARTDLDMLAKHVYQAGDFGVVFFVPEGDPDVPPYHDFMHYLGEKHRAGVAKLADGTTLFLVPPSEFSERVLKVPGNNCLFGVVLKAKQPNSLGHPQLQQQQVPPAQAPQSHHLAQQQSVPSPQQHSQSQGSAFGNAHPIQDNNAFSGPSPPERKPPTPTPPTSTSGSLIQAQLSSLANGLPGVLTPDLMASLTALLPQQNHPSALPSAPLPAQGVNMFQPPAREGIGGDRLMGKGGPTGSTLPVPSSMDNRFMQWPPQNNQQSSLQSQGWPSSQPDQLSGSSGHMPLPTDQASAYAPQPQQPQPPQLSQIPHAPMQQTASRLPGQLQQGYSGAQSQGFSGPGFNGQQMPQQARLPQHPPHQVGGAPLLPSDQLAQLTALLTQRQQQPAQQQQVAQLLQQHYQQQPPQIHAMPQQHQQPPPLPTHQPQGQNYNQDPQQQMYAQQGSFQQLWGQSGPMGQHPSAQGHQLGSNGGSNAGWDGAMLAQGQQQQLQPQPPPQPPTQPHLALAQQQLLQPPPGAGGNGELPGGTAHDEVERQKRFQATLQLAAALLQQMQPPQTPGQGQADQR